MLDQVLAWDLDRWEHQHDFIQWLFPTDQEAKFSPGAPLLTPALQESMLSDTDVEEGLQRALRVFLHFLGLEIRLEETHQELPKPDSAVCGSQPVGGARLRMQKAPSFCERQKVCWTVNCPEGNHNWQRISRVLQRLCLLGLQNEAHAFYLCLEGIWENGELPKSALHSVKHWRENAGVISRPILKRQERSLCEKEHVAQSRSRAFLYCPTLLRLLVRKAYDFDVEPKSLTCN